MSATQQNEPQPPMVSDGGAFWASESFPHNEDSIHSGGPIYALAAEAGMAMLADYKATYRHLSDYSNWEEFCSDSSADLYVISPARALDIHGLLHTPITHAEALAAMETKTPIKLVMAPDQSAGCRAFQKIPYTINQIDESIRAIGGEHAARPRDSDWNRTTALLSVAAKAWIECYPENEHAAIARSAAIDLNKTGRFHPFDGKWPDE